MDMPSFWCIFEKQLLYFPFIHFCVDIFNSSVDNEIWVGIAIWLIFSCANYTSNILIHRHCRQAFLRMLAYSKGEDLFASKFHFFWLFFRCSEKKNSSEYSSTMSLYVTKSLPLSLLRVSETSSAWPVLNILLQSSFLNVIIQIHVKRNFSSVF